MTILFTYVPISAIQTHLFPRVGFAIRCSSMGTVWFPPLRSLIRHKFLSPELKFLSPVPIPRIDYPLVPVAYNVPAPTSCTMVTKKSFWFVQRIFVPCARPPLSSNKRTKKLVPHQTINQISTTFPLTVFKYKKQTLSILLQPWVPFDYRFLQCYRSNKASWSVRSLTGHKFLSPALRFLLYTSNLVLMKASMASKYSLFFIP